MQCLKPKTLSAGVTSALWGPIALRLAQSPNLTAGSIGVANLAFLGLSTAFPEQLEAITDLPAVFEDATTTADVIATQTEEAFKRTLPPPLRW